MDPIIRYVVSFAMLKAGLDADQIERTWLIYPAVVEEIVLNERSIEEIVDELQAMGVMI